MKICMPVNENAGLNSLPYNHFGSAPFFLVYNTETAELTPINNGDLGHEHGMCQPLKALGGHAIDIILVAGIGQGALTKLADQGIVAYEAQPVSFEANITLLNASKLGRFDAGHVCAGHDCGHDDATH